MKLSIKAGSTSQSVNLFIADSSSTTGAGLTGLTYNSGSLSCYYSHAGANATANAITLATLAAVNSAWSSGGFKEIDATNMPGWYRFDIPDAVLATSKGRSVAIHFKGATNMAPLPIEIELTAWDNQDSVRGGLTAMPNVASGSAGALLVDGTGTAAISTSGGRANANTTYFAGSAITAAAGIPEVKVASIATGAITAAAIAADAITDAKVASDVTIASVTGAVGSVTGNVDGNVVGSVASVTAAVTVGTNNDKTGYSLTQTFPTNFSSLGINASGHISRVVLCDTITTYTGNTVQTGDSFARIGSAGAGLTSIGDTRLANLDATISSRLSSGSYSSPPSAATVAAQVRTELTTELGRIDATISSRLASASYTAAPSAAAVVAALSANEFETGETFAQHVQRTRAALYGKVADAGTTSEKFYRADGTTLAFTITVDASGNRSAVAFP